jgi:Ser/Thr protein kinase RdoA (MazF antagonist)
VRQDDPYYAVRKEWVMRRLGPHCGRIELAQFPKNRDEREILKAMGRETANLHLATPDCGAKVLRDLSARRPDWLVAAADAMAKAIEQDWQDFRSFNAQ